MDRLDATSAQVKQHRYRYHANLGTFLVHRWVRQGGDRAKIDDVKRARDEIAAAIEINPNAHFGREKYQLRVIEWIINPPSAAGSQYLPNFLEWESQASGNLADPKEADDAVRGLAGLIVLGNAWESVDVFNALDVALHHDTLGYQKTRDGGRNTLAYLAWLRCRQALRERLSLLVIIGVLALATVLFLGLAALRSRRARSQKGRHNDEYFA